MIYSYIPDNCNKILCILLHVGQILINPNGPSTEVSNGGSEQYVGIRNGQADAEIDGMSAIGCWPIFGAVG